VLQLSISFILITVDNGLMTTPLCGTFFDQQEQLASNGGMAVRNFIRVLCCAGALTGGSRRDCLGYRASSRLQRRRGRTGDSGPSVPASLPGWLSTSYLSTS